MIVGWTAHEMLMVGFEVICKPFRQGCKLWGNTFTPRVSSSAFMAIVGQRLAKACLATLAMSSWMRKHTLIGVLITSRRTIATHLLDLMTKTSCLQNLL